MGDRTKEIRRHLLRALDALNSVVVLTTPTLHAKVEQGSEVRKLRLIQGGQVSDEAREEAVPVGADGDDGEG